MCLDDFPSTNLLGVSAREAIIRKQNTIPANDRYTGTASDSAVIKTRQTLHSSHPVPNSHRSTPIQHPLLGASLSKRCASNEGICCHVLAINHILQQFNLRYQTAPIGQRTDKKKKAGPSKKNTPALTRIPQREPDSSDEEAERLLAQGAQGE